MDLWLLTPRDSRSFIGLIFKGFSHRRLICFGLGLCRRWFGYSLAPLNLIERLPWSLIKVGTALN